MCHPPPTVHPSDLLPVVDWSLSSVPGWHSLFARAIDGAMQAYVALDERDDDPAYFVDMATDDATDVHAALYSSFDDWKDQEAAFVEKSRIRDFFRRARERFPLDVP